MNSPIREESAMNEKTQNIKALLVNMLLILSMVAILTAIIVGGWGLAKYTGILPLKKAHHSLTIDETPITVEDVKAIGELVTATYYDEIVVIVDQSEVTGIPNSWGRKNELVLVQKAHARIGIDLADLKPDDVVTDRSKKAVKVTLPDVKCLDFIMNPTDTDVFSESEGWKLDMLKTAMAPAREQLGRRMNGDTELWEKARSGAKEITAQILRSAGFEEVKVEFASDRKTDIPLPPVE